MKKRLTTTMMVTVLITILLTGCGALETAGTIRNVVEDVATTVPAIIAENTNGQEVQPLAQNQTPTVTTEATEAGIVPIQDTTTAVAGNAAAQVETQAVPPAAVDLTAQETMYIDLYNRVNPGVVSVYMTTGGGSGFVIDSQGYIVTNNHVIAEGGPITVRFADGEIKEAELVGADPQADLALLKVEAAPGELTVLALGDSDNLQVGQYVVAIGSPFGLESTMTTGIVSGLSRSLPADATSLTSSYQIPSIIQTDAAINPGNSGGPLFNLAGEVIGVNTAIESPVRANSGVGFAVPSNVVKTVVTQLREGGVVRYPWLGIAGGTLTPDMAEEMGLDRSTRGVIVSQVTAGGPAASAGLRGGNAETGLGGDVITSVDGRVVDEFDDLLGYIVQQATVGQTIELTVLRNGQTEIVRVTLGERPVEQVQQQQLPQQFEQTP